MTFLEQIQDAYSDARTAQQKPARWRINFAAVIELQKDELSGFRCAPLHQIKRRTLFGAPITVLDDGNDLPTFSLSTEPDGPDE